MKNKNDIPMITQKEAVIQALKILGGVGQLEHITQIALCMKGVDWSNAVEPQANIRRIVRTNPKEILALGDARYELVEHKEDSDRIILEIAEIKAENESLRSNPFSLDSIIGRLKQEPPCYDDQKVILDFLEKIAESPDDKKMIREYKNWLYHADSSKGFRFESGSQNTIYTN